MTETKQNIITPKLGEGIYLVKDVAKILHLNYEHVRRWILGYWDGHLTSNFNYTFGDKGNKAINFYSLIEFYTFYHLRKTGLSTQKIRIYHDKIAKEFNTIYPFALPISTDGKKIWIDFLEELVCVDGKKQLAIKHILSQFLHRIDFSDNRVAERFYPLENSKIIVVDPKHQFGQPTIIGTNIQTTTIYSLYKAGEAKDTICKLYNLNLPQVESAITYHKLRA